MKIIVDLFNQHSGDIQELKRMALQAYLSGADAVKLQLLNSQKIWGNDSRKNLELTFPQTKEIYSYCNNLGIEIFSTVFDEEKLKWIDELGAQVYKIASCTSKTDPKLCELILSKGKLTYVSTGLHEIYEMPFGYSGYNHIKYLYCVSEYPTYLWNKRIVEMPILGNGCHYYGYSDHAVGIAAAVKAYINGAKVLEKHFTLDVNAQNETEKSHLCSFTAETLRQFKNLIRELDIAFGRIKI